MEQYDMIPADANYSKEELIEMYNDAVEMIWALQEHLRIVNEDMDALEQSYEEVSNLLYG